MRRGARCRRAGEWPPPRRRAPARAHVSSPELTRRSPLAPQELLLESVRAELAACGEEGCEVSFIEGELRRTQAFGEEARKVLGGWALADVERIRGTVLAFLQRAEEEARAACERAAGEQSYQRLV